MTYHKINIKSSVINRPTAQCIYFYLYCASLAQIFHKLKVDKQIHCSVLQFTPGCHPYPYLTQSAATTSKIKLDTLLIPKRNSNVAVAIAQKTLKHTQTEVGTKDSTVSHSLISGNHLQRLYRVLVKVLILYPEPVGHFDEYKDDTNNVLITKLNTTKLIKAQISALSVYLFFFLKCTFG